MGAPDRDALSHEAPRGLLIGLSTSLGDLLASSFDFGHTLLLLFGGLCCVLLAALCTWVQRELLFWMTFVLMRPLGVIFGDALSKPLVDGGLQFGPGSTSLILIAAMIVLIPIAGQNLVDIVRVYQPRSRFPKVAQTFRKPHADPGLICRDRPRVGGTVLPPHLTRAADWGWNEFRHAEAGSLGRAR